MIKFSAPGKIHLLGEHAVVYGKPALLAAIDLRVTVSITPSPTVIASPPWRACQSSHSMEDSSLASLPASRLGGRSGLIAQNDKIRKIIEPIVKKELKIKTIPPYNLEISSQIPKGSGMGSSAAVSAAYLEALTSFLGYPWDLKLINELTFEAEKVFHGNPSGGDNTVVVFGGLLWYRKETEPVKLFSPLKQFMLIDSGKPMESTKEMVEKVNSEFRVQSSELQKIFDDQERLIKELVVALKEGNQNQLISIIRQGERNLKSLGVVGKKAQEIIRLVEKIGGAAKITGGGGVKRGSGMLLAYHPDPKTLLSLTKTYHLLVLPVKLGEEGLRRED